MAKSKYVKTTQHKLNLRLSALGRKNSDEARKKMSVAHKGKKLSESTKLKISQALKGKKCNAIWTQKRREKMSEYVKNRVVSEETRKKMSLSQKGHHRSGWKLSDEHKERLSMYMKTHGHKLKPMYDEDHPQWKGDRASYRALHIWVERRLGKPHICMHCKNTNLTHRRYNWANISGEYKRNINDWVRLCMKCHKLFDKKNDKTTRSNQIS